MEKSGNAFIKEFLVPKVGKTAKLMSVLVKSTLAEHKVPLSKEQFVVLLCLEEEAKPQSSLALIMEQNKGSLTRLVQSLEKKEFVKRSVCKEDNRVNWVTITSKGEEILNKTKPLVSRVFNSVQSGIDPVDQATAIKVLLQMQQNALEHLNKKEKIIDLL